jgi:hypothetical protein
MHLSNVIFILTLNINCIFFLGKKIWVMRNNVYVCVERIKHVNFLL